MSTETSKPVRVIVIYRRPLTSFIDELYVYLSEITVTNCDILITGDFNIHFEIQQCPWSGEHGLQQNHVTYSKMGHTLDLVISRISDPIVSKVAVEQNTVRAYLYVYICVYIFILLSISMHN